MVGFVCRVFEKFLWVMKVFDDAIILGRSEELDGGITAVLLFHGRPAGARGEEREDVADGMVCFFVD